MWHHLSPCPCCDAALLRKVTFSVFIIWKFFGMQWCTDWSATKLVSDETCIFLALNHFTQLSLIISHFRWIWNHITSKWDRSFLITSGQTATWRTIIFILTFFFFFKFWKIGHVDAKTSVFVSERTRSVLMCSVATVCHHCF